MIRENDVYKIGVFTKTHGVSGELNFSFTDDVFDRVDADYLVCRMDGILVPFFMEEYRFRSNTVALMKLEGIDTEGQARRMVGVEVFFPKALADEPEEDTYTWTYFTGFEVTDEVHGVLGRIQAVDDTTVNVLFSIETPDGDEILLPAHEEFITAVDHAGRRITVSIPEELLSLNETDE
ncbi:MAG: 16S rRNA processing protein RimM [Paraprevotella sp.]|nr:16S rRNA processing protein RimM [Paraprevotella sp.]MBP3472929.1 16S rRNA processing protein RimM [Paraprevotella sp.]